MAVSHFEADRPGLRLDKLIAQKYPELTRTAAQKLINAGDITVNGRRARPSLKLAAGDRVHVRIPAAPPSPLAPEPLPLNILYEDDDLIVLDKPPGIAVHPAPGHPGHTLVNALLALRPQIAGTGSPLRPGIVHRLDKDTSGLIIVAKNRQAQENLTEQFRSRSVTKVYTALVKGRVVPEQGVIEAAIGRDTADKKRMAISAGGRPAATSYRVVRRLDGYTLLEVMPQTGRTHQIRVHLAAIGYPIAGDQVYGVKTPCVARQFLHASRLGFRLPSGGQYVEFTAGLPEDLRAALDELTGYQGRSP